MKTVGMELRVESTLESFLADGHTRTRATELVIERAVEDARGVSTVVLVEGVSDQIALEILAARCGRDLEARDVAIVPMGGATNIRRFRALFASQRCAGLYDSGQKRHFAGMSGFFECVEDLEDELIRAVGTDRVVQVVDRHGELPSFRRMQNEPFHRGRGLEQQLHRFIASHSGRKYRYARLLAEAVELARVPRPIESLLAYM